jgi:hypothetical protein
VVSEIAGFSFYLADPIYFNRLLLKHKIAMQRSITKAAFQYLNCAV